MSLSDIFRRKARGGNVYAGTEFMRVVEAARTVRDEETGAEQAMTGRALRIVKAGTGRSTVILAPMKSLSLDDFSFPFQNTAKIRDALRLQVMPFTAAGELEIFPAVLSKSGRASGGIVWYVSPDELDIPQGTGSRIWPAPLPFVSKLAPYGGSGVTMWTDEENACSILWQSNCPVMYRWKKSSGQDTEAREFSWYDSYCSSRGLERGGSFTFNASGGEYEDFTETVSESVRICPWIAEVNLSRSALEGARDLERTVRLLARVSLWLLFAGLIMLGAEALQWYHLDGEIQSARSRSERFYRETFDPERTGRISNPVNLARDKIASLTGRGDEGHTLDEVLADLGEVCSVNPEIAADIIRYNQEGIDCTGTAPDMTAVLNFRKSWEEHANLVQVDNTQFVSGIGYRFDLRIRW
ncbi:MAG: hypothetical protein IJP86_02975 [Synergistaceae bacterium]|nr:hypothetical protein [Synergistaceae bacterium]